MLQAFQKVIQGNQCHLTVALKEIPLINTFTILLQCNIKIFLPHGYPLYFTFINTYLITNR